MPSFKPIPGYEGSYEVSDTGVVKSVDRIATYYMGTQRLRGRVLKQFQDKGGYPTVYLSYGGTTKSFGVHTLVALAFLGPRPAGMDVCHNDDVKTNNHASNLRYDSRSSNLKESYRNGRHKWKLTDEQVVDARNLHSGGMTIRAIATKHGVHPSTISRIVNNLRREVI